MKQGKSNQVRIIGGSHRSRTLSFVSLQNLRPTADRIRETLFNWLQNDVGGAQCLDLFAGSGALGVEALSRGAAHVQFVESATAAAAMISENLAALALKGGEVANCKAEHWLETCQQQSWCDILFLDPPFGDKDLDAITAAVDAAGILKPTAKIYIENDEALNPDSIPAGWQQLKSKKAGRVFYYLYSVESA